MMPKFYKLAANSKLVSLAANLNKVRSYFSFLKQQIALKAEFI